MRVSVFGPRDLSEDVQKNILIIWSKFRDDHKDVCFLHGGSKGTQAIVKDFEVEGAGNPNIVLFKPWHMVDSQLVFTPKFMLKRNVQILDNSDLVFIFELEDLDKFSWTQSYCETNNIEYVVIRNPK